MEESNEFEKLYLINLATRGYHPISGQDWRHSISIAVNINTTWQSLFEYLVGRIVCLNEDMCSTSGSDKLTELNSMYIILHSINTLYRSGLALPPQSLLSDKSWQLFHKIQGVTATIVEADFV